MTNTIRSANVHYSRCNLFEIGIQDTAPTAVRVAYGIGVQFITD